MHQLSKAVLALALTATAAHAQVQVLNFEGIIASGGFGATAIGNFYNGGTSGAGTSGTNFGVSFTSNATAVCLSRVATTDPCNFSRYGLGDASSRQGGLVFGPGIDPVLNKAGGFTGGFSLFYTAFTGATRTVSIWSGTNGTGSLLGSFLLPGVSLPTSVGCPGVAVVGAGFCPFIAAGTSFSGTAQSVTFDNAQFQIAFDDLTFGSSTPGLPINQNVVPEPATYVLMGSGLLMLGGVARRRRRSGVAA
jgi:hypothetical protein